MVSFVFLITTSGLLVNWVTSRLMECLNSGTGDHTFERRLRLGGPLLKENIATMVLER